MPNTFEESRLWPGNRRKDVSCPGCGREYGAYGRMVCQVCQECEKCCTCQNVRTLVLASQFVKDLTQ